MFVLFSHGCAQSKLKVDSYKRQVLCDVTNRIIAEGVALAAAIDCLGRVRLTRTQHESTVANKAARFHVGDRDSFDVCASYHALC